MLVSRLESLKKKKKKVLCPSGYSFRSTRGSGDPGDPGLLVKCSVRFAPCCFVLSPALHRKPGVLRRGGRHRLVRQRQHDGGRQRARGRRRRGGGGSRRCACGMKRDSLERLFPVLLFARRRRYASVAKIREREVIIYI